VASIVKSHGGFISVSTELGKGTQIAAYLPASKQLIEHSPPDIQQLPSGNGELVLVIDDEEAIRQITRSTLEAFGYRVLLASDGTEGIATYAEHKREIQIVLTDMMMPFMDGAATARALRRMSPKLKIISASGLADSAKSAEASRAGVNAFLPKPYTAEQLLRTLAEVLKSDIS
jgi:CheY-like chemotaxis protein